MHNRRVDDGRIDKLVSDMEAVQREMGANTQLTLEIRGILAGFKTIARLAKWLTYIVGLATAAMVAVKSGIELERVVEAVKTAPR